MYLYDICICTKIVHAIYYSIMSMYSVDSGCILCIILSCGFFICYLLLFVLVILFALKYHSLLMFFLQDFL